MSRPKTYELAGFMEPICKHISEQIGHECHVIKEYPTEWLGAPRYIRGARGRPTYVFVVNAPDWPVSRFRLGKHHGLVKAALAMLADVLIQTQGDRK